MTQLRGDTWASAPNITCHNCHSRNTLCLFATHLAMYHREYLSGLRHLQITAGLSDSFKTGAFPRLQYVIKGIKREKGVQIKPRFPITPHILRGLHGIWQSQTNRKDTAMLWAACTLAFFGFFRSGEITVPSDSAFDPSIHLTPADVLVDSHESPSMLRIRLKQSKTDPFHSGVLVFIGCILCPVAAVLSHLALCPAGMGPLFRFEDGRALTRRCLVEELRRGL